MNTAEKIAAYTETGCSGLPPSAAAARRRPGAGPRPVKSTIWRRHAGGKTCGRHPDDVARQRDDDRRRLGIRAGKPATRWTRFDRRPGRGRATSLSQTHVIEAPQLDVYTASLPEEAVRFPCVSSRRISTAMPSTRNTMMPILRSNTVEAYPARAQRDREKPGAGLPGRSMP